MNATQTRRKKIHGVNAMRCLRRRRRGGVNWRQPSWRSKGGRSWCVQFVAVIILCEWILNFNLSGGKRRVDGSYCHNTTTLRERFISLWWHRTTTTRRRSSDYSKKSKSGRNATYALMRSVFDLLCGTRSLFRSNSTYVLCQLPIHPIPCSSIPVYLDNTTQQ